MELLFFLKISKFSKLRPKFQLLETTWTLQNFYMALSFCNVISSIQIFNTLSKTIMSLLRPLVDNIHVQNNIFIVETTGVCGPTLARLAVVLVWQSCGKPSTKFPHGELVEFLSLLHISFNFRRNSLKFHVFIKIANFLEKKLFFHIFLGRVEPYGYGVGIMFFTFHDIPVDIEYTLDKVFCARFSRSSTKTLITR